MTLTNVAGHPVRFEIVDPAHRVLDARAATTAEVDDAAAAITSGATVVPASTSGTFVIAWIGSVCDRTARLTVATPASDWRLAVGGRLGCDAAAAGHGVVVRTADAALPMLAFTDAPRVPERVAGLDVVTVTDAISRRETKLDDTELAVFGYRNDVVPIPCPYPLGVVSPVQPRCPDTFAWLMQDPEDLVTAVRDGTTTSPPNGPAINPLFRPGVPTANAALVSIRGEHPRPVAVVLVGHFDDYRSALCPKADVDGCRRQFVVDAEAWIDGIPIPEAPVPDLERWNATTKSSEPVATAFTPQDAPAVLERTGHHPVATWVVAVAGADLYGIDPRAKGSALATAEVVWVIREVEDVAGRPAARTYFVIDGQRASYFQADQRRLSGVEVVDGTPESPG